MNSTYMESFNCRTVLSFYLPQAPLCVGLAISPYTDNGMRLRVAPVSVFEWKLVGPKGQGHIYVCWGCRNQFSNDSFHNNV